MNEDKLKQLRIAAEHKQRSNRSLWVILLSVFAVTALVLYIAVPRLSDATRSGLKSNPDLATDDPGSNLSPAATGTSGSIGFGDEVFPARKAPSKSRFRFRRRTPT